ncbi:hypothetical protein BDZ89DRAFT_1138112 [Hymenopellis radicata]|nr:hypothetical protein BDZ89DRAFT_1138112 [Hymenopellis radicata]
MADEYRKDKKNRRRTPIGKWKLASMSKSQFDSILLDTKGTPFTSEIDEVLVPHHDCYRGSSFKLVEVDGHDLLQHAWMRQMDYHGKTIKGQTRPASVDVDKEAVSFLEDRRFSQSKMAGVAGNRRWDLDIRSPQSDWVPRYDEAPERWKDNLRVGLDKEREFESNPNKRPAETQDAKTDPRSSKRQKM